MQYPFKKFGLAFLFFLFAFVGIAQQATIFGNVKDTKGDVIRDVAVKVVNTDIGQFSKRNGDYSVLVQPGEVLIEFSSIGFDNQIYRIVIKPGERRKLNVRLVSSNTFIDEVVVTGGEQDRERVSSTTIDEKALENLPAVTGGVETLIKTLPGVSSRNELSSQYAVRGGNFDENLVYINGFEVDRPQLIRTGQQEGLSIINPDMTRKIYFSAGGFEPQYGDKMSSVLDISYKRPESLAGSANLGFLGGGLQLGNKINNSAVDFNFGARFHSNKYLLNTLDEKGAYNPYSYDVQGVVGIEPSENSRVEFLGYAGRTVYDFEPSLVNSNFGAISQILTFKANQDGFEKDIFRSALGGISYSVSPKEQLNLKFSASYQDGDESENIDISSAYFLGTLDSGGGAAIDTLTQGFQRDSVSNKLATQIFRFNHTGVLDLNNNRHYMAWGLGIQQEKFNDKVAEFRRLDTVNYQTSTIGNVFFYGAQTQNDIKQNKYTAFLQDTYLLNENGNTVITAGARLNYSDYSKEVLVSPRVQFSHRPEWDSDIVFRAATGLYHQPTTYRDARNRDGDLNLNIKAQKSFQVILGSDLNFEWRDLPMKFTAEAYYKNLWDIIPYEYDVIRIRYLGDNSSTGYAQGLDLRLHGEFVEDAESWITLSYLKTEEDIIGQGEVRRPQDQRINASILFQDYLPGNENFRVKLVGLYGSNAPTGVADGDRANDVFQIPAYKRMDVGFAVNLKGESAQRLPNHPFTKLKSVWLNAEVFNLFDIENTSSFQYILAPKNVFSANEVTFAVPNGLTGRRLNAKLSVRF